MQISKSQWSIGILGLLALLAVGVMWRAATLPATENQPEVPVVIDETTATEAPLERAVSNVPAAAPVQFAVNPADTIASWNFKGAYTDNETLTIQAQTEIARLTSLLGTGTHPDYTLYVSVANMYNLLGDGANEFTYLKKALAIDATATGLAWHNIGHLFARLGAYATARTAFERAVAAEPIPQFRQALADFLAAHPEMAS